MNELITSVSKKHSIAIPQNNCIMRRSQHALLVKFICLVNSTLSSQDFSQNCDCFDWLRIESKTETKFSGIIITLQKLYIECRYRIITEKQFLNMYIYPLQHFNIFIQIFFTENNIHIIYITTTPIYNVLPTFILLSEDGVNSE